MMRVVLTHFRRSPPGRAAEDWAASGGSLGAAVLGRGRCLPTLGAGTGEAATGYGVGRPKVSGLGIRRN